MLQAWGVSVNRPVPHSVTVGHPFIYVFFPPPVFLFLVCLSAHVIICLYWKSLRKQIKFDLNEFPLTLCIVLLV